MSPVLKAELERLAELNGCRVSFKPNGHVQIYGRLTVNYYPDTKDKRAYVNGTRESKVGVDFIGAIRMAIYRPEFTGTKKRPNGKKQSARKRRLHRASPRCHWCKKILMLEDASVDHVIPLARGGLDNDNNLVLSCVPCNQKRGCEMPEFEEGRLK